MALGTRGSGTKKPIPHEPGEWMEFVRLPAYLSEERTKAGGDLSTDTWVELSLREKFDLAHRWLVACLVGWSYAEPLAEDSRIQLDMPTLMWAYTTAVRHNFGVETSEEKKADSGPSTPISTMSPEPSAPTPGA